MVLGIAGCTSTMSILARGLGCSFKKSESSVIMISPERDASPQKFHERRWDVLVQ